LAEREGAARAQRRQPAPEADLRSRRATDSEGGLEPGAWRWLSSAWVGAGTLAEDTIGPSSASTPVRVVLLVVAWGCPAAVPRVGNWLPPDSVPLEVPCTPVPCADE